MPQSPYHADTPLMPAHYQPAWLLEHARAAELNSHVLLRGSGLFEGDFGSESPRVSTGQMLILLRNLVAQDPGGELPFLLGQQMLPGHYGVASLALMQAPSLGAALRVLVDQHAQLCPLLAPRLTLGCREITLDWFDACGAGALRPVLVDLHMTAVTALCRWLGGERLPWRYHFNRTRPRSPAQHHVHLGQHLQFGEPFDRMVLDAEWLDRPWPRGDARAHALTLRELAESAGRTSFLHALREWLFSTITAPPTLDAAATHSGVSPATLKRQLARHGTHFQALLDEVRAHVAVELMRDGGCDHDAVAAHLRYHDARSLRRALARWFGIHTDLIAR